MLEALALCVASIHDGDTFWTCDRTKVRLVAEGGPVDAPDYLDSPRCKPQPRGWCDQALAVRSRDRLGELIGSGRATILCDGKDRFGRALCKVRVNGRDVGDQLVREGLAVIVERWRRPNRLRTKSEHAYPEAWATYSTAL